MSHSNCHLPSITSRPSYLLPSITSRPSYLLLLSTAICHHKLHTISRNDAIQDISEGTSLVMKFTICKVLTIPFVDKTVIYRLDALLMSPVLQYSTSSNIPPAIVSLCCTIDETMLQLCCKIFAAAASLRRQHRSYWVEDTEPHFLSEIRQNSQFQYIAKLKQFYSPLNFIWSLRGNSLKMRQGTKNISTTVTTHTDWQYMLYWGFARNICYVFFLYL